MSNEFGPFSVDPAQVTGLGGALFQELINRHLAAETAAAGLSAANLRTSYQANVGDKGVDALVESAQQTDWIPSGDSAWQFKAGDLGPESCAAELENATYAHEILRRGGKYRLVLGKGLEAHLIEDRETKLREKAEELGFDASGDRFKVIDGNQLARWVERYPALAVSKVLRATGHFAIGFDSWSLKNQHRTIWVASTERDDLRTTILSFLGQPSRLDLRIEGASGLGKSRGTLEALRGSAYEPLVVYVGDASDVSSSVINHLTLQNRSAVLVIDECGRKRHKVFAEQLEINSQVRVVTIGDRDASLPQYQPVGISELPNEVIDKVLTQNYPALWPEVRRLVVDNCAGNVRWALYLAQAMLDNPKANVADLIDAAGLREFILGTVTSDSDFLAISALALISRYGIDREKRFEMELLATGLDIPIEELAAASHKLEERGLLTKHGRYRAVSPQPLAVLLASHAWDELGDKIIGSLLPSLNPSMAERLFLRAADIGSAGPAAVALNKILGPDGPFGSLASIADEPRSRLLIQLAIISPAEVTSHLEELISAASDEELQDLRSIRRNLVWTLEKLVWHTATFEAAADMLLRLAKSENETFSNNATGTWNSLFGGLLPATAARPADRLAYLERVAADESAAVRKIAVAAADHALDPQGMVMVSGELQGGVVVEPRGGAATWDELWSYIWSVIDLLRVRAIEDPEAAIREAATKALVDAIHPFLENEFVREELFDTLAALPAAARRRVWSEINHLHALFDRVETPEFVAATGSSHDVIARRAGLNILTERLQAPDQIDELKVLADARRWEWEDGELERKIVAAAQPLTPAEAADSIFQLLTGPPPAAASYELGAALYAVAASPETLASLARIAGAGNVAGLVGYLYATLNKGDADAFDVFLDGALGQQLDAATRLTVTVRGPRTSTGWTRVLDLERTLPVHVGAPRLFGWHVDVADEHIEAILSDWLPRIDTQQDYNAAVDVTAMLVFGRPALSAAAESKIAELVEHRAKFGELGQQSWDWVQLARRSLAVDANKLLISLLRQVDTGSLHLYGESEEKKLLQETISAAGSASLDQVMELVKAGTWRLRMDFRGWLANVYSAADVMAWIGQDLDRARLVASLTGVGDGPPSELVQFLLDNFGTDDQVSSSLNSDFVSGWWSGNESNRLDGQINQLNGWASDRSQPPGVRTWARDTIAILRRRRDLVLEQEAEEER